MENKENGYLLHFGVKIKKTDRNKLARENYCIPTDIADYRERQNIESIKKYIQSNGRAPAHCPSYYYQFPNEVYVDEKHHTDQWVEEHYSDCMENFDLNMAYFNSLDSAEFERYLRRFVKKNRLTQIEDLNELSEKTGIYVMVLDEYKQMYIGISERTNGIKGRIMQHWSRKVEFSRLIYGKIENSILSIDSFGALDTTRIFYKEIKWYQDIHEIEEKMVSKAKKEYILNRVAGGINTENDSVLRNLKLLGSMNMRKFKD